MVSRPEPKMTLPTQMVLRALLKNPTSEMYGLQICAEAQLASGTIHPILARLEQAEWLESYWEDIDPHEKKRPRRRYYRLNPEGAERARYALARVSESKARLAARNPALRPGLAGGAQ
jgi:PadR family transcriptional regulator PadR